MEVFLPEHEYLARVQAAVLSLLASGSARRTDLQAIFGYGKDKLNRRLRSGHFSAYELGILRERYGIAVSVCAQDPADRSAVFRLPKEMGSNFNGDRYLAEIADTLERLSGTRSSDGTATNPVTSKLLLASTDLHVLAQLGHRDLALYRAYFYEQEQHVAAVPFQPDQKSDSYPAIASAAARASRAYGEMDSTEVIGPRPFESHFVQFGELADRRCLGLEVLQRLTAAFHLIVDDIAIALKSGEKPGGGRLTLYENSTHAMSPLAIGRAGERTVVATALTDPSLLISEESETYAYFEAQFERRRQRSRLIGGPGVPFVRAWSSRIHAQIERGEAEAQRRIVEAG